MYSNAFFTEEH